MRAGNPTRVGRMFIAVYAAAYLATSLVLIAPLLVTLALKVNSLVGTERAPNSLSLIAGVGSLVAMVGNPLFGRLSDRTTSRFGMRRPWMLIGLAGGSVGILVVALAPTVWVVLVGWCLAQLFFNAHAGRSRGGAARPGPGRAAREVAGVLGVCLPDRVGRWDLRGQGLHRQRARDVPGAVRDRRVLHRRCSSITRRPPARPRGQAALVAGAALGTYYVFPRRHPDFAWAFASRFMFLLAYAFLVTYQAYYLLEHLGSDEDDGPAADLPGHPHPGGLRRRRLARRRPALGPHRPPQALRGGRRVVYGVALFLIAVAGDFDGFLVGMAVGGLGFGLYMAVDLALVADVLPDAASPPRTSAC